MTDDRINDLVSSTAKAHDADFGSLAIYAALKAATEDRIYMTDNLIDDGADASGSPPERPYVGLRRREIPRLPRGFLAAAATIAFIAACAAGVALAQDDDQSGGSDRATTTTEQNPPTGQNTLEEQIIAANRDAYANSIVHEYKIEFRKGSISESWHDDSTLRGRWRITGVGAGTFQGRTIRDYGQITFDGAGSTDNRDVDYCFSEYAEYDDPANASQDPDESAADRFQWEMENDNLVVGGRETHDGRDAIRLDFSGGKPGDGFIWLDANTLLPFVGEGGGDSDGPYKTTYEYLPRTAENFDLLVAPLPEGFTKIEKLREDPDAYVVAGCETFEP